MSQEVTEGQLFKLAIYAVATCVIVFFLTIGGCTMHGNAYEADVAREEAAHHLAMSEVAKIKAQAEASKVAAIKALIEAGENPVAARCGIMGWDTKDQGSESICNAAAMK